MDGPHENLCPDIGLLASRDPVALDKACLDLTRDAAGGEAALQRKLKAFLPQFYVEIPLDYQLQVAEDIGLGTMKYNLHTRCHTC
jgi:hypothetical protein